MKIIKILILFAFIGAQLPSFAQDKQLAKASALIQKAVAEKEKGKQMEMIQKVLEIYKEIKMVKEGNKAIGDAFFDAGDLTSAARYYVKCDKQEKKEGYEKIGKAYIDEAFNDPKTEAKTMKKALDNLNKGIGMSEACRVIGDAYFDKGEDQYPKALEYYVNGGIIEGIKRIADLYYAGNVTQKNLAPETYAKMRNSEGYRIAGDIYYEKKEYGKAFEFYSLGGNVEGFRKYADAIFDQGKVQEANSMYERVADSMKAKEQFDDMKTMAATAVSKANYALAAKIYDKLADKTLATRYTAYAMLMDMNFFEARDLLKKENVVDLPKAIDAAINQLSSLQQYNMIFGDIKNGVPQVNMKEDPNTKEMKPDKSDLKAVEDYYNTNKEGIADNVYKVSEAMVKIVNPELKRLMMQKFLQFKAVRTILDNNTFQKKMLKPQIQGKDVVL